MVEQGIDSRFLVYRKRTDDPTVIHIELYKRGFNKLYKFLSAAILRMQKPVNHAVRSLNIFPTGIHRTINKMDVDVVQLHWINRNTISITEIAKINKPIVWKLPDMWAFNGSEHYISPGDPERYRVGYKKNNRPSGDRGIDIDRWVWKYKRKRWRAKKLTIVTPSKWLGECAKSSVLFGNYKVYNIPNPIDLDLYKPYNNKSGARRVFGLPEVRKLILFGSINATGDRRKGFHHLHGCLASFAKLDDPENYELVIMGSSGPENTRLHGIKVHYLGPVFGDDFIRAAYSAVDVLVLPTEADNLPNTIQEAMACGTPCVGFDVGGLPDMIAHNHTGYLAKPFDEEDLAKGLLWVLNQDQKKLSLAARGRAVKTHDPAVRVAQYLDIYQKLINDTE